MVGAGGKVKLIDFELSCLLGVAEVQVDTQHMGAVHWRSPEYLAGARLATASDVFSFAICVVEVISGEIPWGRSALSAAIRFRLRRGEIPLLPDSLTEKQRHLIRLMTKFDQDARVRISYVVDKLREIVGDEKVP